MPQRPATNATSHPLDPCPDIPPPKSLHELIYHCQQRSYNLLLVIEALAESEAYHDNINRVFTALATLLRPVCDDLNEIEEHWTEEVQP
jgi:hypothetical protein